MNIIKKTIILSDKTSKNKPQMVLELENKNSMVFGCLKSYNQKYLGDLILGIKSGAKIVKQNISFVDKKCQFKLSDPIDLGGDIDCVMVDTSKDFEPILWGNAKANSTKSLISSLKESVGKLSKGLRQQSKSPSIQNSSGCVHNSQYASPKPSSIPKNSDPEVAMASVELTTNDTGFDLAEETKAELFETNEEELTGEIDRGINTHNFYDLISDQIAELFARYPREKNLEALVDGSEWCKIDSDTEGRYYVVGIIKKDGDIRYICYGVPGSYDVEPPRELRGYSQWLPTDPHAPYTSGYWVMYQDSDTGENVMLE